MSDDPGRWKRCSSCKKDIDFSSPYWACSVSSCNRKRTGMVFCSVSCWEVHLPLMRHREAYAVEKRSPSRHEWDREQSADASPQDSAAPASGVRRRVVAPAARAEAGASSASAPDEDDLPRDILVVASKLKKYIRARSGMNTSDGVLDPLSDHLRAICKQAIRNAASDGRKTILDRDIPRPGTPRSE